MCLVNKRMKFQNDLQEYSKAEKVTLAGVVAIVTLVVISWAADGFATKEKTGSIYFLKYRAPPACLNPSIIEHYDE